MFNKTTLFLVIACIVAAAAYTFRKTDNHSSSSSPTANSPANQRRSNGYFKTHFQDESQFIVETIIADLSEMAFFAKHSKLPDAKIFSVETTDTPASTFRAPVYDVAISLQSDAPPIHLSLKIDGPIWSPDTYSSVVETLFKQLNVTKPTESKATAPDWAALEALTDGTTISIEKMNSQLSAELQNDFRNPHLHEKAALLMSAFALQECSGSFYDVRSQLCRITSHLALARSLGSKEAGVEGRLADAILDTLMNRQVSALEKVSHPELADARCAAWVRSIKARNTKDYRELDKIVTSPKFSLHVL